MQRTDEFWAGFFDGDGAFNFTSPGRGKKPLPRIVVNVAHEETIRLATEEMGVGTFVAKKSPSIAARGRKPTWTYRASARKALEVTLRLYPWLCDHREAASKVILHYHTELPETLPRGLQFFAGLFDAEGSCSMTLNQGKKRPFISLKMGNEALVRELQTFFNEGHVVVETRTHIHPDRKTMYAWHCMTQSACRVIKQIEPLLIYQKERAQPILAYAT